MLPGTADVLPRTADVLPGTAVLPWIGMVPGTADVLPGTAVLRRSDTWRHCGWWWTGVLRRADGCRWMRWTRRGATGWDSLARQNAAGRPALGGWTLPGPRYR